MMQIGDYTEIRIAIAKASQLGLWLGGGEER